jgi:formylglycine-generating enzyme required for sulfatase activity
VTDQKYPWGNDKNQSLFPKQTTGNVFNGPEPVGRYGKASLSPFGVSDLIGNVWQYTSEFGDAHTRAILTRGGSNYRPSGSMWYYPEALELDTHEKYFLMDARYERAGTIGFRCGVRW